MVVVRVMYTVSERVIVVVVVKCNDRGWSVWLWMSSRRVFPHSSTTSRMQSRRRRRTSVGEGETKKVEMVETAGYCRAVLV